MFINYHWIINNADLKLINWIFSCYCASCLFMFLTHNNYNQYYQVYTINEVAVLVLASVIIVTHCNLTAILSCNEHGWYQFYYTPLWFACYVQPFPQICSHIWNKCLVLFVSLTKPTICVLVLDIYLRICRWNHKCFKFNYPYKRKFPVKWSVNCWYWTKACICKSRYVYIICCSQFMLLCIQRQKI